MPSNGVVSTVETPAPPAFVDKCEPSMLWDILVNATGSRVGVFDADGKVVFANAAANAEFGPKVSKASVVGLNVADYTPPDYAEEWKGFIRLALQGGRAVVVESMIHGRRFRATFTPFGDGEDGYVIVVSRNLTDLPAESTNRPGVEVIQAKAPDLGPLSELTEREMEVLELIGEGLSTAEVARRLDRSVKTVEWHRAALGSKLGITNRVELARIAIGAGLCRVPAARHSRKSPGRVAAGKG